MAVASVKYASRVQSNLYILLKFFLLLVFIFYVQISTIPASRTPVKLYRRWVSRRTLGPFKTQNSKVKYQIKSKKLCTNPNFYAALCLVIGRRLYFTMVKVSMAVLIYLCKNFFLRRRIDIKILNLAWTEAVNKAFFSVHVCLFKRWPLIRIFI